MIVDAGTETLGASELESPLQRLWKVDLLDTDISRAGDVLSADEIVHAEGMAGNECRRYLARRIALRELIATATGIPPATLELEQVCSLCGKRHPASVCTQSGSRLWWSASSDAWTYCVALSSSPVGVDIQSLRAPAGWREVIGRCFTLGEMLEVGADPERFITMWTLKEAFLKALGIGLSGRLDALDCSLLERGQGGSLVSPAFPKVRLWALEPWSGVAGALVTSWSVQRPHGKAADLPGLREDESCANAVAHRGHHGRMKQIG
ncbi:MAG: 4'-phosphopantetheinyl transferase family protein [Acidimicrobiales bacterium]